MPVCPSRFRALRAAVLPAFALSVALGCSGKRNAAPPRDEVPTAAVSDAAASAAAPAPVAGAQRLASVSPSRSAPSAAAQRSAPTFAASATDTAASTAAAAMLIRTGTASIEVDSVEQAVARLRELAVRLGGYVANASLAGGTDQVRSATLEIKVPSARFDALTGGLRPLGHVETVDVKAEDVGEEYVDVGAQLDNGRRLEARLVALADRQSSRLADLLSVERELARVRGEIDRAEGRLRYLRAHAATSTLTVTVHARAPIVGDSPSANPIAEAFREAWRIFVGVVAFFIAGLGVLVPLAVLGTLGVLAWRRWGRPAARAAERAAERVTERTGEP